MDVAWQYAPSMLLLLAAGVLSTGIASYGLLALRRSGRSLLVAAFVVLNLAVAEWALVYAVQVASPTLAAKTVAYNLLHIGGVLVPPAWVVFAAAYADRDRWITPVTVGALLVVPAALLVTLPTNPWSLAVTDVRLVRVGGIVSLETGTGPVYQLFLAYSYVLLLAGSALVAGAALSGERLYSAQSALLLAGATVPLGFNLVEMTGVTPLGSPGINYTPVSLSISALLFGIALFRYRLFDLQPVARRTVYEHVREGVVVLNAAERVVGTNDAARRLLADADAGESDRPAGSDDGAIGRTAAAVLPEYERLGDDPGESVTLTFDSRGRKRYVEARRSPLERDGRRRGWVVLFRDVTAREESLREVRRRNERLDEFANVVAHDLRNPLDVVAGHARLARETGDEDHLDTIEATTTRMGRLLENVLRLARSGRTISEPRPVAVADAAGDAWSYVDAEAAALTVETDATVTADPDALGQLFENLFRNAVEHGSTGHRTTSDDAVEHGSPNPDSQDRQNNVEHSTTTGPSAADEATGETDPAVTIRVGELADRDGLYVADDGAGFDGDPTTVFDPGFSTDADGTGLGLHVVEQIADAHEWDLTARDADGGGFRIDIEGVEFTERATD